MHSLTIRTELVALHCVVYIGTRCKAEHVPPLPHPSRIRHLERAPRVPRVLGRGRRGAVGQSGFRRIYGVLIGAYENCARRVVRTMSSDKRCGYVTKLDVCRRAHLTLMAGGRVLQARDSRQESQERMRQQLAMRPNTGRRPSTQGPCA